MSAGMQSQGGRCCADGLHCCTSSADSTSTSAPSSAVTKAFTSKPVPGYVECEWLLEDFRTTSVNDWKAMAAKSEADLMRMARKVIIHSRVVSQVRRDNERGPGHPSEDLLNPDLGGPSRDGDYPVPRTDIPPPLASAEIASLRVRRAM